MNNILKQNNFECRVSSVLNKNVKSYGKQYMFDGDDETCWNSDSGSPQWVIISFEKEVDLKVLEIQFQGGFAGNKCHIEAGIDLKNLDHLEDFFPEDINSVQRFQLTQTKSAKVFRLVFESSTDFFGRIIIYNLMLRS